MFDSFPRDGKVAFLCQAAMIAALYAVLGIAFRPISFSVVQCRIAEALTVLPFFTLSAVPGLTVGCLLTNILGGADVLDVIFGTMATGMAAGASYLLRRNKWLVPIPPIAFNAIIIPFVLKVAYMETTPVHLLMVTIFIGQFLSCGVLGTFLLVSLDKYRTSFAKNSRS